MTGTRHSVAALARNAHVQAVVATRIRQAGQVAIDYYDRHIPGLVDALGVDRARWAPVPESATSGTDWSDVLVQAPRKGWYAWCRSRDIDPAEFRAHRDAAAQEAA